MQRCARAIRALRATRQPGARRFIRPAGGFGRDVVAGYRFDALSFCQLHLELHRGLLQNLPRRRIFSTPGQPIHCARIPNGSKGGSATAPTQLASTGVAANGSVGSVPDKCRVLSVFWFRAQDAREVESVADVEDEGQSTAAIGATGIACGQAIGSAVCCRLHAGASRVGSGTGDHRVADSAALSLGDGDIGRGAACSGCWPES